MTREGAVAILASGGGPGCGRKLVRLLASYQPVF
jgi:hypothetical protein